MTVAILASAQPYQDRRPAAKDRLFTSEAVEARIVEVEALLSNAKLRWMFRNCFPNTLIAKMKTVRPGPLSIPETSTPCGSGIPEPRSGLTSP